MFNKLSNTQKGTLLAFIGVMIVTPDSLIIRLVSIDTWNLLFYRSLFPGTALLIGYFVFFSSRAVHDFMSIGNGIQNIMETQNFSSSDILKIEYLLPVLLISIIVIVPVIYKFIKKRFLV